MSEINRADRRRLEAQTRKLEAMMDQVVRTAEQRATGLGLVLDTVYTKGDDLGFAIVINLNIRDADLCEADKVERLVSRLSYIIDEIDEQPEISEVE